jgi:hypothetical protein
MQPLKYLLMLLGVGLFGSAGALVAYDIFLAEHLRQLLQRQGEYTLPRAPWFAGSDFRAVEPDKDSASQYTCGWPGRDAANEERP